MTITQLRRELERIPDFEKFERAIEIVVAEAPADEPYELLVIRLCPQMESALATLNGQKNVAVMMSVLFAKLIESRRGFPA